MDKIDKLTLPSLVFGSSKYVECTSFINTFLDDEGIEMKKTAPLNYLSDTLNQPKFQFLFSNTLKRQ